MFGCVAYTRVGCEKLEKRELKYLFLGYPSDVNGHKLWCDDSKRYIISKDVTLEEDLMFTQIDFEDSISSLILARQVRSKIEQLECTQRNLAKMHKQSEVRLGNDK